WPRPDRELLSRQREVGEQGSEVDALPGGLFEKGVGVLRLAAAPERAQERPRPGVREPRGPEGVLQVAPEARLERPRAQVARGVEEGVDVGEPGLARPVDADGGRQA